MITPDRAIALYHLRRNPDNRDETEGRLTDGQNARGALGLVGEAVYIDLSGKTEYTDPRTGDDIGVYRKISSTIECGPAIVYELNDNYDLSFRRVADVLELAWREEISYSQARRKLNIYLPRESY